MLVVVLRGRPGLDSGVGEGVNPAVFSPFTTKLCEVGVLRGHLGTFRMAFLANLDDTK